MSKNFLFRFLILFAGVFGLIFLFVWFYLSVTVPADAAEPVPTPEQHQITFDKGQVQVRSRDGRAHVIAVELAITTEQQSLGLMYRTQLPENTGMLFIYKPPRRIAMWMKNTLVPLDMVFASRNGTIFYIFENAEPLNENLIPTPDDAAYVLELPAGTVKKLGLHRGDRLVL